MTSNPNKNKHKKRKLSISPSKSNDNNKTNNNEKGPSLVIHSKKDTGSITATTTTTTTITKTTTTTTTTSTTKNNIKSIEKSNSSTNKTIKSTPKKKNIPSKRKMNTKKNKNNTTTDNNEGIIELEKGKLLQCKITKISTNDNGIYVKITKPSSLSTLVGLEGYIDGFEISDDINILQNITKHYTVDHIIKAKVIHKYLYYPTNHKLHKSNGKLRLSILRVEEEEDGYYYDETKRDDLTGNIIVGRINRHVKVKNKESQNLSLLLNIRGKGNGALVRCCITELMYHPWKDMPLGTFNPFKKNDENIKDYGLFDHGKYVQVRILSTARRKNRDKILIHEGTLRTIEQKEDVQQQRKIPKLNDIVQGYVIYTNDKRSVIRLSSKVDGTIYVKNISDSYIRNPTTYLPSGKVVTAKVIEIDKDKDDEDASKILLDMRKSTLDDVPPPPIIKKEKIKINQKYKGIVSRVESYGVFVKLQSVNKTALAHISECADKYIKDLKKYYSIGDLVKVYVLSIDESKNNIAISLKPTHFENDDDSSDSDDSDSDDDDDDDSSQGSVEEGGDEEQPVQFVDDSDDDDNLDLEKMQEEQNVVKDDELEVVNVHDDSTASDNDDDDEDTEDDNSISNDNLHDPSLNNDSAMPVVDTAFDFEWDIPTKSSKYHNDDASRSDDSSSSNESDDSNNDDDDDNLPKNTHKSRKNAAKKQRLEKQISMREQALADGTADLNPETISDLERLITSNPNLSQHYIKYMAYYLSCSDIDAARNIGRRALNRIDFRKENEKLNIWTSLLALECKFGTQLSFDNTLQDACQRNNPKHVYLRVCEMLQREIQNTDATTNNSSTTTSRSNTRTSLDRATTMFQKMCKRFRTKKTVWISYFQFLLENNLHEEAHAQLKQSLLSLPKYKHIPTLSKFAQFEYDYGSIERGRTIFNTLIESNPKRIDLLFLYVDKEIKQGYIDKARGIFQKIISCSNNDQEKKIFKYNDNQMKRVFKKWYTMEETYNEGNEKENFCDEVKIAAKEFVNRTMS